jgi:hypothetical protein
MALGLAALALGIVVLSGLRLVEQSMSQERTANLVLVTAADTPPEEEIKTQSWFGWMRN